LGTLLSELFPTTVRYTGSSVTFNLAGIFGASLAPYIATWLAQNYGLQYVGYYLAAAAALTLALYLVPHLAIVARPLALLSTIVHELGHGLTALALGGELHRLYVWPDGSGVAQFSGAFGRLAHATTAAGGLLGPPFGALALFLASRSPTAARRGLGTFTVLLAVALALWVRNPFGLVFVGALCAVLGVIAWKASPHAAQVVAAFLAMQLTLSVFSRADYLFTATASTGAGLTPSDTAQIADALLLPYWFWGGLIACASLAILAIGLKSVARAL
ncbi:MAG TPA: M50 family metallopeptidase, partial [Nevskiaceae bacterium]|nr:M50 family metallopeptidase [Nevskiaceae bacterium]